MFPKVSKCTFLKYGPSGTTEILDAFCVLPINIINEKVFLFLWFWFIILAVLTAISCLVRIFTLTIPKFRLFLFKRQVGLGVSEKQVELIFRRCQVGDWFLLMLIGQNVTPWVYDEVLIDLAARFEGKTV